MHNRLSSLSMSVEMPFNIDSAEGFVLRKHLLSRLVERLVKESLG
ncbi:hypothetical protein [Enterovibrio sp. FF113]